MKQNHEEKFFERVIKLEQEVEPHVLWPISDGEASYYQGKLAGIREVIRLMAIQVGKNMKDGESVVAYCQRWLSMEYSQTDIPDKMKSLDDTPAKPKVDDFQQWLSEHEVAE